MAVGMLTTAALFASSTTLRVSITRFVMGFSDTTPSYALRGKPFADSLKSYPRQAAAKLQAQKMQEVEQMISGQSLPADQSTLNKIMAMNPGINNQTSNNHTAPHIANNGSAVALNNYQCLLRSSLLPNNNPHQSSTYSSANQPQPVPHLTRTQSFHGSPAPNQQQPPANVSFPHQSNNSQASQVNQHLEQHVIQQLLQEMMNNKGAPQQPLTAPNPTSTVPSDEVVGPAVGGGAGVHARMGPGAVRNDSGQDWQTVVLRWWPQVGATVSNPLPTTTIPPAAAAALVGNPTCYRICIFLIWIKISCASSLKVEFNGEGDSGWSLWNKIKI